MYNVCWSEELAGVTAEGPTLSAACPATNEERETRIREWIATIPQEGLQDVMSNLLSR